MKKLLLILMVVFSASGFAASGRGKRLSVTTLVGIPHPLNFAVDYRLGEKISFGVTGGAFGITLNWSSGDQYKIATQNIEGRVRFHPMGGAFFIGMAAGTQSVTGDTARSITSSGITVDVAAKGEITNNYVIPHLGWIRTAASGFTIGLEAGLYVPFSPNTNISLTSTNPLMPLVQSTAEYQSLHADTVKFGNDIGGKALPFITVLRLGWAF